MKLSDWGYLKNGNLVPVLHVGYKTIFIGTSDEYKSMKLESIYLFVEFRIYQFRKW